MPIITAVTMEPWVVSH